MRVGQALGLRHADVVSHERRIELVARTDNANGARGKGSTGSVPITSGLVRLHSDYMHEEYGELRLSLREPVGGRIRRPLTYAAVDELVRRTRVRVGFFFTAHMLRHTFATLAATAALYRAALEELDQALTSSGAPRPTGGGGQRSNNNPEPATCACPRRIRVARSRARHGTRSSAHEPFRRAA